MVTELQSGAQSHDAARAQSLDKGTITHMARLGDCFQLVLENVKDTLRNDISKKP